MATSNSSRLCTLGYVSGTVYTRIYSDMIGLNKVQNTPWVSNIRQEGQNRPYMCKWAIEIRVSLV